MSPDLRTRLVNGGKPSWSILESLNRRRHLHHVHASLISLVTASGQRVRSQWSSSVKVNQATLRGFPSVGLIVNADYSGFEIRSNAMGYAWEGRVSRVRPVVIDKPKS